MAQADNKEDVLNVEDFNPVSELVEYALYSVSSEKHLSGRGGQKNPKLKKREPKGDDAEYLTWKFESVGDGNYALTPLSAKGYYLDGRDGAKDPLMKKGDPKKDVSLQWKVVKAKENQVGLQGVSSGAYLSGRGPDKEDPTMQKRELNSGNEKDDNYLRWILVPLNYKLHATVTDFDFGPEKNVVAILNKSKKVQSQSSQVLEVNMVGLKANFSFSETMENTTTISHTNSVGIGVSYTHTFGLPDVSQNQITVTASYNYTHNKENTDTTSKTFQVGYEFAPPTVGKYEVGMIVYAAKNVKLDYTAKVEYEAKDEDNVKNVLKGSDLQALLFYHQSEVAITSVDKLACYGTVNGSMKATYAVQTEVYNKKLE